MRRTEPRTKASYVLKKPSKEKKKSDRQRLSTVDSIDYVYYKNPRAGGEFIFPELSPYVTPLSSPSIFSRSFPFGSAT